LALTPGIRLGVYEITAQIGAGGMGEVYQATDNNLKRSVAIKVMPRWQATRIASRAFGTKPKCSATRDMWQQATTRTSSSSNADSFVSCYAREHPVLRCQAGLLGSEGLEK
jgi:hypothetical protein